MHSPLLKIRVLRDFLSLLGYEPGPMLFLNNAFEAFSMHILDVSLEVVKRGGKF